MRTDVGGPLTRFVVIAVASTLGVWQAAAGQSPVAPDPAIDCPDCAAWNAPVAPRRIFGNTYSVGVAGLSSVLIATADGLILLDGALPQSAPLIDANIRTLGYRTQDIKLILNSHAHYDHAGGIAALQRASGAMVATGAAGVTALAAGEPTPDDPQYRLGRERNRFPAVTNLRVVRDGEELRIGDMVVTAHLTPGHTPGSTSWAWRACEGATCRAIVYADSLNAVSAPDFRFTADAAHPGRIGEFRRSIQRVAGLPCDILLAVHPQFAEGRTCRTYAADAERRLADRILQERP